MEYSNIPSFNKSKIDRFYFPLISSLHRKSRRDSVLTRQATFLNSFIRKVSVPGSATGVVADDNCRGKSIDVPRRSFSHFETNGFFESNRFLGIESRLKVRKNDLRDRHGFIRNFSFPPRHFLTRRRFFTGGENSRD